MSDGLYILDVSNPNAITEKDIWSPDRNFPTPNPNAVQGNAGAWPKRQLPLLCNDAGGIRVIDISDKPIRWKEKENSSIRRSKSKGRTATSSSRGHYAYVATDYCGMEVWDLTHPRTVNIGFLVQSLGVR